MPDTGSKSRAQTKRLTAGRPPFPGCAVSSQGKIIQYETMTDLSSADVNTSSPSFLLSLFYSPPKQMNMLPAQANIFTTVGGWRWRCFCPKGMLESTKTESSPQSLSVFTIFKLFLGRRIFFFACWCWETVEWWKGKNSIQGSIYGGNLLEN